MQISLGTCRIARGLHVVCSDHAARDVQRQAALKRGMRAFPLSGMRFSMRK